MGARKRDRKRSEDRILKYVAVAMCAIGLISVGLGVKALVDTVRMKSEAELIPGVVVENAERGSGKNRTWAPVVAYNDGSGEGHLHRADLASQPPAYATGETVMILLLKQDEGRSDLVRIDSFFENWAFVLFALTLGLGFTAFGALLLRLTARRSA